MEVCTWNLIKHSQKEACRKCKEIVRQKTGKNDFHPLVMQKMYRV